MKNLIETGRRNASLAGTALLTMLGTTNGFAQAAGDTLAQTATEGRVMSAMQYWDDCASFRWALGFVLVLGLLGAFYKYLINLRQSAVEKQLAEMIDADGSGFGSLVEKARTFKDNLFGSTILLIAKAIDHGQVDRVDDLIESYRNHEDGRMSNFTRWMTYFSGACGALGLLGTVHGISSTFGSGNFSKMEALQGMGVALATTAVGLVFSLILDFAASGVNMSREKRLQRNLNKADELKILAFDAVAGKE